LGVEDIQERSRSGATAWRPVEADRTAVTGRNVEMEDGTTKMWEFVSTEPGFPSWTSETVG
jgi:hypothetical protein